MSAFLCTPATFDAIASYAATRRLEIRLTPASAANTAAHERFGTPFFEYHIPAITYREEIARELHRENVRSLNSRYPDTLENNDMGTQDAYTPKRVARDLTHAQVLGAVRCYTYQACESDDWKDTLAAAICEAVERHAISELADMDKTWPVEEELVRPVGQPVPISLFELASSTARRKGGR